MAKRPGGEGGGAGSNLFDQQMTTFYLWRPPYDISYLIGTNLWGAVKNTSNFSYKKKTKFVISKNYFLTNNKFDIFI